jgi:hypothetical protein
MGRNQLPEPKKTIIPVIVFVRIKKWKIIIPVFIQPITPPVKTPMESSGRGVVQIHSTPPATNVKPEWSGQ